MFMGWEGVMLFPSVICQCIYVQGTHDAERVGGRPWSWQLLNCLVSEMLGGRDQIHEQVQVKPRESSVGDLKL